MNDFLSIIKCMQVQPYSAAGIRAMHFPKLQDSPAKQNDSRHGHALKSVEHMH